MKNTLLPILLLIPGICFGQSVIHPPSGNLRIEGGLIVTNTTSHTSTNLVNEIGQKGKAFTTGNGITNVSDILSANLANGTNITFTTNSNGQISISASLTAGDGKVSIAGDTMTGTLTVTGLTNSALTASRALVSAADKSLASSATTSTELGYVSGVTSAIQTQFSNKQPLDATLTTLSGKSTTGSGNIVLATSPSLTTPVLGDATGTTLQVSRLGLGVAPNATAPFYALANSNTTGMRFLAAGELIITDDTSTFPDKNAKIYTLLYSSNRTATVTGNRGAAHSRIIRYGSGTVNDQDAAIFAEANDQSTVAEVAVTAASNASPIVITTASHPFNTGDRITVYLVGGNTAANGIWTITKISGTQFSLNTSTGNGAYTSGGTATSAGLLYGLNVSVSPLVDRNGFGSANLNGDDVAAINVSNKGTGRATDLVYIGHGGSVTDRDSASALTMNSYVWDGIKFGSTFSGTNSGILFGSGSKIGGAAIDMTAATITNNIGLKLASSHEVNGGILKPSSALGVPYGGSGATSLTGILKGNGTSAFSAASLGTDYLDGSSISDTAFASSWNGVTTIAPTKNAVYDWAHTFDTDDNGKVNVLDMGAGLVKTDSSGVVSAATTSADILGLISDETGSGSGTPLLVFNQSPTIVTPTIASFANANHNHQDSAGGGTLTLASAAFANQGTTSTVLHGNASGNPSFGSVVNADIASSTIDLTAKVTGILPSANGGTANGFTKFTGPTTSEKTFTLPNASATLATHSEKLSVFAATSSSELAGVLSDETGSGLLVFATSPALTTPDIGSATATTINKVTITAPASSATLTIANGKTLTVSNDATVSGTNTGDQTSVTGNAGTATALQTPRTINGVSFDGTANITVTAAAGTLTGSTLASGVTASSLTSVGTISSGTWNGSIIGTAYGGTGVDNSTGGTANQFFARPNGSSGAAAFRAIVAADIPTLNQNTTGSAASLTTARAIYGNNFDGTAALNQVIASTYGGTGNGFTKFTGPTTSEKTFTLPNADATLAYHAEKLSVFAATSSSELAGVLSDETGSGLAVFGTAPTIAGGSITGLTTFGLRDTSAAFDVTVAATSSSTLTAGRTLTLDVGNVAHTLAFGTSAGTLTFPTGTKTVTSTSNTLGDFAATTSAQLYGVISDETGSGSGTPLLVFNQSPTIVTPTIASFANATHNHQDAAGGGTLTLASAAFANQGTTSTVLHGNASGNPSFGSIVNADITAGTIDLTTKVTGILPSANGGTANGFTKFSGPASSEKTFTLPNASATVLTDNAAVTIAQGGTGAATAAAAFDALAPTTTQGDLIARGASSNSRLPLGIVGAMLSSDGTDPIWMTSYNFVSVFDEYLGTQSPIGLGQGTANSGVVAANIAGTIGAPGIIQMASGTSTNGISGFRTGPQSVLFGGGHMVLVMKLRVPTLSDGTDTYTVFAGFSDAGNTAVGQPVDGAYFCYSSDATYYTNTTKWSGRTSNNSARTEVSSSTTVAANTFYVMLIDVNAAASTVDFQIGTSSSALASIGTSTTNIPTATGRETGIGYKIEKQAGTNSRTLDVDFTWWVYKFTSSR